MGVIEGVTEGVKGSLKGVINERVRGVFED